MSREVEIRVEIQTNGLLTFNCDQDTWEDADQYGRLKIVKEFVQTSNSSVLRGQLDVDTTPREWYIKSVSAMPSSNMRELPMEVNARYPDMLLDVPTPEGYWFEGFDAEEEQVYTLQRPGQKSLGFVGVHLGSRMDEHRGGNSLFLDIYQTRSGKFVIHQERHDTSGYILDRQVKILPHVSYSRYYETILEKCGGTLWKNLTKSILNSLNTSIEEHIEYIEGDEPRPSPIEKTSPQVEISSKVREALEVISTTDTQRVNGLQEGGMGAPVSWLKTGEYYYVGLTAPRPEEGMQVTPVGMFQTHPTELMGVLHTHKGDNLILPRLLLHTDSVRKAFDVPQNENILDVVGLMRQPLGILLVRQSSTGRTGYLLEQATMDIRSWDSVVGGVILVEDQTLYYSGATKVKVTSS